MKNKQKLLNITAGVLAALVAAVVVWGCVYGADPLHMQVSDGIEPVDLDTIYLQSSGVEVHFSDVILSGQNETRKLIVSTQKGTVSTKLTDRLIKQLDFDFMKKTQNISYTGTGYFDVDLDNAIEQDLRSRLREKFDTAANGQAANELAVKMVKEVYEPIVKAIDRRYSVVVQFKNLYS